MFRFMMGELAVCIFLAVLVGILVFMLFLTGYAIKHLAVLIFTLLLPFASMLKIMILKYAAPRAVVIIPGEARLMEYMP